MQKKIENLFELTDKIALVTGTSSGLGYRFCQILSQAGAEIIALARREDKLKGLEQEISHWEVNATFILVT